MRAALLGVFLIACGDDGNGPRDAPAHDAARDGAIDAAHDAAIDAALDAAPDAPPDAAPLPVHVHVQALGVPVVGIDVLFHDPAGALIGRTVTDASGDATGDIPDGSQVTVVPHANPAGFGTRIRTVTQVQGGDALVFGEPAVPMGPWTGSVPAYTPAPTSLDYEVVAGSCLVGDSQSAAAPFPLQLDCLQVPAHGPAMATALTFSPALLGGYDVLGWIELADTSFAPGTIAFAGPYLPPLLHRATVTGIPAGHDLYLGEHWYRNGVRYWGGGRSLLAATSGMWNDPGGGDAWIARTEVCTHPDDEQCQWRNHVPADPLVLDDDFAATRTAWVAPPTVTLGPPTTVDWSVDVVPDMTFMELRVMETDEDPFDNIVEWDVLAPAVAATSGTVRLPDLPADLASVWVGVEPFSRAIMELHRTVSLSYAAVRARWFVTGLDVDDDAQGSISSAI